MKRSSKWDEKLIETQLNKMPKIEDKQSKEVLFERIQERLQENEVKVNNKKKSWFIPAVASAAVLFLLFLIVPPFLNEQDITMDVPEMADDANIMMEINEPTDRDPEFKITEEFPGIQTTEQANHGYYIGAAQPIDEQEFGGELVTIAVAVHYDNGELVVPLTVLSGGPTKLDKFMIVKDVFSGERWGLGSFPAMEINSITEEKGRIVVIDVPEGSLESLASAESEFYSLALRETFSSLGFNEIQFTSDGEEGVFWGQHGTLYEMDLQQPNRGYYLYESTTGHKFLVNGRTVDAPLNNENFEQLDLQETLELMKLGDENKGYSASIPEDVLIINVEKSDDIAKITFAKESFTEYREDYLIMVEAILFAAKDFDIQFVQFEGMEQLYQIGPYRVNELIETPNYINFIR